MFQKDARKEEKYMTSKVGGELLVLMAKEGAVGASGRLAQGIMDT